MSEFQSSLLIIALVVVAAVWAYGWWQQWRYRRTLNRIEPPPVAAGAAAQEHGAAPAPEREHFIGAGAPAPCTLLDEQTDYIVSMTPKFPLNAQALARVWERRFDFGKTLRACGCNAANGTWERIIPESAPAYSELRIGLQLVDRDGAISATRLAEFRELMGEIGRKEDADMVLPLADDAMERARELDAFCAEVDQMIGLNLVCGADRPLFASDVAGVVQPMGMSLQADGTFHLFAPDGATLFTLGVSDGTPFQHHTLDQMRVTSLTLVLDIPRVSDAARRFDEMTLFAMELATALRATLVDDQQVLLGKGALEQIRIRVASVEQRMVQGGIAPGSAQAMRLFA
ncbi:cell division protein ZipA C-terminal FtsZ-binding domain-containing protein [Ferrigenium sp. UT5]|uniref:cell division protein ZipA C-terminal FtsZ-binding domain-containing protein n=1 Tax=Ferrigenium sp. UT5 TaxID=3242105 RepID=UPI00354D0C34